MPHEVRREVGCDHQVGVDRYEAPRERGVEDALAVPCHGEPDQLRAMACGCESLDELLHEELRAAPREDGLRAAYGNVHVTSSLEPEGPAAGPDTPGRRWTEHREPKHRSGLRCDRGRRR